MKMTPPKNRNRIGIKQGDGLYDQQTPKTKRGRPKELPN